MKKCSVKRLVSIVMVGLMICSCFVFPVSATETDVTPTAVYEMRMEAGDITRLETEPWGYYSYNTTVGANVQFGGDYTHFGSLLTDDPEDSTRKVINTGLDPQFSDGKFLFGREFTEEQYKNKVVEVWANIGNKVTGEQEQFMVSVGNVAIIAEAATGGAGIKITNYYYNGGNKTENTDVPAATLYSNTNLPIERGDGWHQFVFDYSKDIVTDADMNTKEVDIYIDGTKVKTVTVDNLTHGSYNRYEGNRIILGNGKNAVKKNYYFKDLALWNGIDLEYVLSKRPYPLKPVYNEEFTSTKDTWRDSTKWTSYIYDSTFSANILPTSKYNEMKEMLDTTVEPERGGVINFGQITSAWSSGKKWLIGRDLSTEGDKFKNGIVEVWTNPGEQYNTDEGMVMVGQTAVIFRGTSHTNGTAPSGISYQYYGGANASSQVSLTVTYPGTNTPIIRSDGWHQIVFDYSGEVTAEGTKTVAIYIDGAKIAESTIDNEKFKNDTLDRNRIDGTRIIMGTTTASTTTGAKPEYMFDDVRIYEGNAKNLERVLAKAPGEPVAKHVEGQPLFKEDFDAANYKLGGWGSWKYQSTSNSPAFFATGERNTLQNIDTNILPENNSNVAGNGLKMIYDKLLPWRNLRGINGQWKNNAVVETWFYDDVTVDTSITSNSAGVYVGRNNASNVFQGTFLGITSKSNAYYTYAANKKVEQGSVSSVPRSTGWHQFVFDYTVGGNKVDLYIDGIKVAQVSDVTEPCNNITLGDEKGTAQSTGTVTNLWFDTVRVWAELDEVPRMGEYITCEDVTYVNASDEVLENYEAISAGDTVKAKYTVSNDTWNSKTIQPIIAVFDTTTESLIHVGTSALETIAAGAENEEKEISVTIPDGTDVSNIVIKTFFFDSYSNIAPLTETPFEL